MSLIFTVFESAECSYLFPFYPSKTQTELKLINQNLTSVRSYVLILAKIGLLSLRKAGSSKSPETLFPETFWNWLNLKTWFWYTSHPNKKSTALAPISSSLFYSVTKTWKESMAIIITSILQFLLEILACLFSPTTRCVLLK